PPHASGRLCRPRHAHADQPTTCRQRGWFRAKVCRWPPHSRTPCLARADAVRHATLDPAV
ncbi:hypothetical protein GGI16_003737, partial [Coemansia sp. S142-1]